MPDPFFHASCTSTITGCLRRTLSLSIPSSFPQGLCRLVSMISCARRLPASDSSLVPESDATGAFNISPDFN